MTLVEWNDKLSIGVSSVDEQHKQLVGFLNELYDAVQARQGHEKLGQLFNELIDYTVYHFSYEETLFTKTGYPAAPEHKKEHDELTRQVLEKKQKYEDGAAPHLPIELLNFLRRWLLTHIAGSDRRAGPHLIARGIK
jgi:hemerythrin